VIAQTYIERQCPGISFSLQLQADASTSGQFRISLDGTPIATSSTVTGGSRPGQRCTTTRELDVRIHATAHPRAQRTAGTGTIRAQQYFLQGVQS
jgi:hypothetical protein